MAILLGTVTYDDTLGFVTSENREVEYWDYRLTATLEYEGYLTITGRLKEIFK